MLRVLLAAGIMLGAFLMIPRPLPPEIVVTQTVETVRTVNRETVSVAVPVVTPDYRAITGANVLPDISEQTESHSREVVMLTYWELLTILADTGWRPWIIASYYDPESKEWIQDITMQQKLYALAFCESTLNPDAVGDNGASIGLFQINQQAWPELTAGVDLFDPELNAEMAYQIWKHSGQSFKHWSCHVTADVERRWRNND